MTIDGLENVPPEDWPLVLANLRRALKPGAHLYLTVEEADDAEVAEAFEKQSAEGLPVVTRRGDRGRYRRLPLLPGTRTGPRMAGRGGVQRRRGGLRPAGGLGLPAPADAGRVARQIRPDRSRAAPAFEATTPAVRPHAAMARLIARAPSTRRRMCRRRAPRPSNGSRGLPIRPIIGVLQLVTVGRDLGALSSSSAGPVDQPDLRPKPGLVRISDKLRRSCWRLCPGADAVRAARRIGRGTCVPPPCRAGRRRSSSGRQHRP